MRASDFVQKWMFRIYPIARIQNTRHCNEMAKLHAILGLAMILSVTACSAEPAPSVARARANDLKSGETVTTMSLSPPQWRKDPNCFERGGMPLDEKSGYFDVEKLKWRHSRTLRGYFYTNFEGASFVAAQRTDPPDGLGVARYQTDLYSNAPDFPNSVEPRTYWVEFVGKEALCNSQSPDDATFDIPFSHNLVWVEKIIRQVRVR